jgi:hypothetical protein
MFNQHEWRFDLNDGTAVSRVQEVASGDKVHKYAPGPEIGGQGDMFVRNQPFVIGSPAANRRTEPESTLALLLGQVCVPFVQVKHMRKRDVPADRDSQVMSFQADSAVVFIEPPHEIIPNCVGTDEAQRGNNIEIEDVGRIK